MDAVRTLRAASICNVLVVDAGGNGQGVETLLQSHAAVFSADPCRNLIFSLHCYEVFTCCTDVSTAFQQLQDAGVPFMVGEFGCENNGKAVPALAVMQECYR